MNFFHYRKLKCHCCWHRITATILYYLILINVGIGQPSRGRYVFLGKLSFNAGVGYDNEDFTWSIAGDKNGENPNILSELIYKDLQRIGVNVNILFKFSEKFSFEGSVSMKRTVSGNAIDTDYAMDNRTDITNQLYLKSDKGDTKSFKGKVIYSFYKSENMSLQVNGGYGLVKSGYNLSDAKNARLNSSYVPTWTSPFLGVKVSYALTRKMIVSGTMEGSYLNYNAKANWNLIEEFQHPLSFDHRANGIGFAYSIDYSLKITKGTTITLSGNYIDWKTNAGVDRLYLKTGETLLTRLNSSKRITTSLTLGVGFLL